MYIKVTKCNRIITEIQRFLLLFSRHYYFQSITTQHRATARCQLMSAIIFVHSK